MTRSRCQFRCDVCSQIPSVKSPDARPTCACAGKEWDFRDRGVGGDEDEARLLADHGYTRTSDVAGDIYYVSDEGWDLLHLYGDGTWDSDHAPEQFDSLPEYLAWRSEEMRRAGL
jgi:hypothetical protein